MVFCRAGAGVESRAQLASVINARTLLAVFNAIDIEPILLKGAAYLVAGIINDMGARYVCDLESSGSGSQPGRGRGRPNCTRLRTRFDRCHGAFPRHHYPQLQKPGESSPVELHDSIGAGVSRRILSGEEMVRDSQAMEWRGMGTRPFTRASGDAPDRAFPGSSRLAKRSGRRCAALYDLSELSSFFGNLLDPEAVRARFRKHGKETTLLLHLLQAQAVLGISPAFAFELGWWGDCDGSGGGF